MTRRLLRWFRREPREAVRPALEVRPGYYVMDVTATTTEDLRRQFADAIAAAQSRPPMLLPAVHSVDAARPAADVLGTTNGQPTPDTSRTAPPSVRLERVHEGATEDFGDVLRGMREDLAHDTGSLDPDERVWDELLAEFDSRLAQAHMDFLRGWSAVERDLDHVAPGWAEEICPRRDCPLCAHTFDEALATAGVIALPSTPVDYSTAEWPVVVTA